MNTKTIEKLDAAITRANEMALGASMEIMDVDSASEQQDQGRYLLTLFSEIRDVLDEARRGYWEPGTKPEDWESLESSRAMLRMASAVLAEEPS
jgi:hypothetical protein